MSVTTNAGYMIKMTAQSDAVTGSFKVGYVRWVNGVRANEECLLKDTNGSELFHSVADGPNYTDLMPIFRWVNGLTLTTLDSGTLYIYLR